MSDPWPIRAYLLSQPYRLSYRLPNLTSSRLHNRLIINQLHDGSVIDNGQSTKMSGVGTVNGVRLSREWLRPRRYHLSDPYFPLAFPYPLFQMLPCHLRELTGCEADDPNRVVTVSASAGVSGQEIQISYTNCKVVGNGSFGVVWAAKMLGELCRP